MCVHRRQPYFTSAGTILDPETDTIERLFDPRRQRWSDHFTWGEQGTHILGRTSIGRATVIALNLNRPVLVQARQAWVWAGWHPPVDDESS